MHIKHMSAVFIFAAGSAFGGALTVPAKIAGKIAAHGSDNVVEHVVTRNADDIAEAAAKGGARAVAKAAPEVVRTVDAAVEAARIESHAAKPAVEAVRRMPIPKPRGGVAETAIKEAPKIAVGAGVGIGALVAANNLTVGERELDKATGDAIRDNPDIARKRVKGSVQWKNILAACGGAGLVLAFLGLAVRIARPLRPRLNRHAANGQADNDVGAQEVRGGPTDQVTDGADDK